MIIKMLEEMFFTNFVENRIIRLKKGSCYNLPPSTAKALLEKGLAYNVIKLKGGVS